MINPEEIFSDHDPDRVWGVIFRHICGVIEAHCPLRSFRITTSKPEYLTDTILALMPQRDKAFRVARRLKTPETWCLARSFCARVARELRIAKRAYISEQLRLGKGTVGNFGEQ